MSLSKLFTNIKQRIIIHVSASSSSSSTDKSCQEGGALVYWNLIRCPMNECPVVLLRRELTCALPCFLFSRGGALLRLILGL